MSSLEAQASERKARLAKLKNLKRKQNDQDEDKGDDNTEAGQLTSSTGSLTLSGRNYDPETKAPRLGFDSNPAESEDTLEQRAAEITEQARAAKQEEEKVDKPVDLFSLQPKTPNWDLKRDVDKKLERLEVRTNAAIAKLVRERILASREKSTGAEEKDGVPQNLAEIVRQRQRDEEREEEEEDKEDD